MIKNSNNITRMSFNRKFAMVAVFGAMVAGLAANALADVRYEYRPEIRRQWVEPRYEYRQVQVWVEPVYRTVVDRVWTEPVYRTVVDRIWVEPVYRMVSENVWVEPVYQDRQVVRRDWYGRPVVLTERVLVSPGHYEMRERRILSRQGGWQEVTRQELVCAGGWRDVTRQELVCAGHYEMRTERVLVSPGRWEDRHDRDRGELDIRIGHGDIRARIPIGR